jgi:hypothetical protein
MAVPLTPYFFFVTRSELGDGVCPFAANVKDGAKSEQFKIPIISLNA